MSENLVKRLRERARIRRQIPTRKSVQEGQPDRIADLLEEAAAALSAQGAGEVDDPALDSLIAELDRQPGGYAPSPQMKRARAMLIKLRDSLRSPAARSAVVEDVRLANHVLAYFDPSYENRHYYHDGDKLRAHAQRALAAPSESKAAPQVSQNLAANIGRESSVSLEGSPAGAAPSSAAGVVELRNLISTASLHLRTWARSGDAYANTESVANRLDQAATLIERMDRGKV